MNRLLLLCLTFLFAGTLHAQDFNYDKKTGLVAVAGQPSFYLIKLGTNDYRVEGRDHKPLISITLGDLRREGRSNVDGFKFTFAATGNYCSTLSPIFSLNYPKIISTIILRNRLVVDNTVPDDAERTFVSANNGSYLRAAQPQVVVNIHNTTATQTEVAGAVPTSNIGNVVRDSVWFNGEKAYTGSRLIGSFQRETDIHGLFVIYGPDDLFVAKAGCYPGCAEWNIETKDEKTFRLRNYPDRSLERVFEFLLRFKYLK